MKALLTIAILFIAGIAFGQDTAMVNLGDSSVQVLTRLYPAADSNGHKGIYFIHLHQDETTALQVAQSHLQSRYGMLVTLWQSGGRFIYFSVGGKTYMVDPNRIFSMAGARKNMSKLAYYNSAAGRQVKKLADTILNKLHKPRLVIAMHNNKDGKPLSTRNYIGRKMFRTHINKSMDSDDFVLTTERKVFNYLKAKNISVILELPGAGFDDGSLSAYCNRRKIPYINIEAQEGHAAEQAAMLQALDELIATYNQH
ncbi:hypothetical protein [Foetidibacter luteolus]|uniref:hypothetical protein n=1 Tax=Foetidibacter luteolus TaxID=2608880 RepID=UPI00129BF9CA|nr:hypothetical protein [Foetidibacter luteolus]